MSSKVAPHLDNYRFLPYLFQFIIERHPITGHYITCFFYLFFSWGEAESTWYCGNCLAYCTASNDKWLRSNRWNANLQGKLKYSEKTCSSATLSTTNPIWSNQGSKTGRRYGTPATNCLSYGTAYNMGYSQNSLNEQVTYIAFSKLASSKTGGATSWRPNFRKWLYSEFKLDFLLFPSLMSRLIEHS
jgi:hypothetical protein